MNLPYRRSVRRMSAGGACSRAVLAPTVEVWCVCLVSVVKPAQAVIPVTRAVHWPSEVLRPALGQADAFVPGRVQESGGEGRVFIQALENPVGDAQGEQGHHEVAQGYTLGIPCLDMPYGTQGDVCLFGQIDLSDAQAKPGFFYQKANFVQGRGALDRKEAFHKVDCGGALGWITVSRIAPYEFARNLRCC